MVSWCSLSRITLKLTGFSDIDALQISGEGIVSDAQKIAQPNSDQTDPVKRKPQFSIRKLFLWTTIVAVGLVITTTSYSLGEPSSAREFIAPFQAIFSLSFYTMAVCGLWTLIETPKSFNFWFPAGMSVFLPVFILLCMYGVNPGPEAIPLVILCLGVPYGIGLLALITRSTSKRGFSLAMLVFCVGCWL